MGEVREAERAERWLLEAGCWVASFIQKNMNGVFPKYPNVSTNDRSIIFMLWNDCDELCSSLNALVVFYSGLHDAASAASSHVDCHLKSRYCLRL